MQIRVTDTGQGIPTDFLPYVFDRFRQADPSATRGAWGLGIGLSIAKHIVELHGGTIGAASRGPGEGSTFIVQLPASRLATAAGGAVPMPGVHGAAAQDGTLHRGGHRCVARTAVTPD